MDPTRDARDVDPDWRSPVAPDLWVRRAGGSAAGAAPDVLGFDPWRIAGRKRLTLNDAGLKLRAAQPSGRLHAQVIGPLSDGDAFACALAWQPSMGARMDALTAQVDMLTGMPAGNARTIRCGRAGLLHLRALQAHDGAAAGASQRDIAALLFGEESVAHRWHPDGELRAQVRHLLRRAQGWVHGGYLALAGAACRETVNAARKDSATGGERGG